ncbi:MAG: Disulfide bond formation protein DsbB [Proteobacteria bacterium]|nr:Disulfide bond formation protein DsbB [Pseudomonadota bacterium]
MPNVLVAALCALGDYVHRVRLSLSDRRAAETGALGLVGVIACVGLIIGAWQSGAQWRLLGYPDGCTSAGMQAQFSTEDIIRSLSQQGTIPCDLETFTLFGLSLANWNVLAMGAIIAVALRYLLLSGRRLRA